MVSFSKGFKVLFCSSLAAKTNAFVLNPHKNQNYSMNPSIYNTNDLKRSGQVYQNDRKYFNPLAFTSNKDLKSFKLNLSRQDAEKLATNYIDDFSFVIPDKTSANIKEFSDIDKVCTASLNKLNKLNSKLTKQEMKAKKIRALKLLDNVGQEVVNKSVWSFEGIKQTIPLMGSHIACMFKKQPLEKNTLQDSKIQGLSIQEAKKLAYYEVNGIHFDEKEKILSKVEPYSDIQKVAKEINNLLIKDQSEEKTKHLIHGLFLIHDVACTVLKKV